MSSRVFWGFSLVLVGALLLASNLGALRWDVWVTLWKAWPVLLVLWGVSIILRPMKAAGAVIMAVVALVAVAAVLYFAHAYPAAGGQMSTLSLDQALEGGVETVELEVDFGAGSLSVDGDAAEGRLATGTLGYIVMAPEVTYQAVDSDKVLLRLRMASGNWSMPPGGRAPRWDIHLSPVPAYILDLDTGACEMDLNLSALRVSELRLETGAADAVITLGDHGLEAKADLNFGAASIRVRVPRSVGVRVKMSTGLVGSNLSQAGFSKVDQWWESSDYDAKGSHIEITVDAGASSFNIEWID